MTSESSPRAIAFTQVFNFRDVGGYRGLGGRTVRWRRLFRSDSLAGLTEHDRDTFQALGVRTVIDLRNDEEVAEQGTVPAWDGLTRQHLPPPHLDWTAAPNRHGDDVQQYLVDRYVGLCEDGATSLVRVLAALAEPAHAPAVVHCVAGKDRTGVVCALTLALLGVADDDIDADYTLSTRNNLRYIEWLQRNGKPDAVMRPWFHSVPGTMVQLLERLRQRHGSIEKYAVSAGLGDDRLAALRHHLLG